MQWTKEAALKEMRLCLAAANLMESGETDVDTDTAVRAAAGYALRELAERAKPAIPALAIARNLFKGMRP